MDYYAFIIVLGFPGLCKSFWPASYRVGLRDQKIFVISAGEEVDDEDDDESENEMIQPDDLADVAPLADDEDRYKPLHSHVEHYNRRAAEAAARFSHSIPELQTSLEEINPFDEEKPFIAGFKHELDEYNFDQLETANSPPEGGESFATSASYSGVTPHRIVNRSINSKDEPEWSGKNLSASRQKRDEEEEDILGLTASPDDDLLESMSSRNHSLPQSHDGHATPHSTSPEIHSEPQRVEEYDEENTSISFGRSTPDEPEEETRKSANRRLEEEITTQKEIEEAEAEIYDYENFRAEYDEQFEEARSKNLTFNFTDSGEPEETAKDAIRKIVAFDLPKNCTKEELEQFGARALECLAFDYQHSRNSSDVRRVLARTWSVLRIWLCIYVGVAVPCWLQKGWCCCCFRCSLCFPDDVILATKHYYAQNPPGVLVEQPTGRKGAEEPAPINYKPTLFELETYEDLESAIRNL